MRTDGGKIAVARHEAAHLMTLLTLDGRAECHVRLDARTGQGALHYKLSPEGEARGDAIAFLVRLAGPVWEECIVGGANPRVPISSLSTDWLETKAFAARHGLSAASLLRAQLHVFKILGVMHERIEEIGDIWCREWRQLEELPPKCLH